MSTRLGIIGGYLGSGKTTLVNLLLAGALPGRNAVVVNDFGSVNIDADLIASAHGDTIELTNGCICCQLSDDVARTMTTLAARTDLDNVLCEVSGVGDPGELASWGSYPGFAPGPVLVCADATDVVRLLRDQYVGDTVHRQLAAADVVLLTKTDLAIAAEIGAALDACSAAAPQARLLEQDRCHPERTAARAFAVGAPPESEPAWNASQKPDLHADAHASSTLSVSDPVEVEDVARALKDQSSRLVRAKGTLRGFDDCWHELQLAAGRVEVQPRAANRPAPANPGLVLIASGSDPIGSLEAAATVLAGVLGASCPALRS
ncbi:CobW family GTP-binding protein [Paeniglutamicibacter sp. MACA_103]|uniref:CobW family GTP-binding protein n=1 Tax=Paeniglutamicibacter sp. MACA_103 TaxID=3377337 RepID=UPI003893CF93